MEGEAVADSIDRGMVTFTVEAKLTDVDQLRRLAVQARPEEAASIAASLAVAWQSAADPFAPLRTYPGIEWRPGQGDVEHLPTRASKSR